MAGRNTPPSQRSMTVDTPDIALAGALAAAAVGSAPVAVKRFSTGLHHYVFEARFERRAPVVVRISREHSRPAMVGAYRLSHRLRALGIPLPRIIAEGLRHRFPHLVLERLPGSDLGNLIRTLSDKGLEAVAAEVVRAQRITAATATGGRYGYAVDPAGAPRERWSQVLQDNLARSRRRVAAAGLFDLSAVAAVAALVSTASSELDRLPPTGRKKMRHIRRELGHYAPSTGRAADRERSDVKPLIPMRADLRQAAAADAPGCWAKGRGGEWL